ncbi:Ig-like domain-containing protein [Staphylococcus pseudintermedius]|uniref:Ig-like domain-containing protein n=1 Tax=Staphylococcus pseudintermedius TaxID=283734 RepID=UPI002B263278|nr:Ig-like domain-containing protein [Staphylococcus pseudintermedius]WQL96057.1 Ig-like domain-containing protein [Staphylococcus pseudintermedius]
MVRRLKLYTNGELKDTAEGEGRLTVSISGLEPATSYPAGIYQVCFEENGKESEKVDSPAFTTKPILVTSVTFTPENLSLVAGDDDVAVATVTPSTASNSEVTYTSDHPEIVTVDRDSGELHAVAPGTATITATTKDSAAKTGHMTVVVTAATV